MQDFDEKVKVVGPLRVLLLIGAALIAVGAYLLLANNSSITAATVLLIGIALVSAVTWEFPG